MMHTLFGAAEWAAHTLWALSWQIGVLVFLVWVASLVFRKAAPNFRYGLWCVVLLRLCIPAALALPWGVSGEVRQAAEASAPPLLQAGQWIGPFAWSASSREAFPAPAPRREGYAALSPRQGLGRDALASLSRHAKLGLAWMAAALSLIFIVFVRNLRARWILRSLPEVARPDMVELVEALRVRCAIRRPVRILTNAAGQPAYGPAVAGIMRPVIVLPAHIAEEWSLDDVEPVLLHEFAHIKRWDLLVNGLQMLIQAVYFFHPLVWFVNARIRQERELVCDDLAVLLLRGRGRQYSRSFIRVIEDASLGRTAGRLAGAGMTEHPNPLARRIVRMAGKDYRLYRPLSWLSVALLLFVAVAAIAVAAEGVTPAGAEAVAPSPVSEAQQQGGSASLSGRIVSEGPVAGSKVILAKVDSTETIETEVSPNATFEFGGIPSGTYFITVKPEGHAPIDCQAGGWRLIDFEEGEQKSNVALFVHWWEEKAAGGIDVSLDVPLLKADSMFSQWFSKSDPKLTWSRLPDDLRREAERHFVRQHDNWLGIQRLSAKYRWTQRRLEKGEWTESEPRTGEMAYEIVRLTREEAKELGHGLPMRFGWRVDDAELDWHAAADDLVSGPKRLLYWQDGHESEASNTPPEPGMLPFWLFRAVPTTMAMTLVSGGSDFDWEASFRELTPAIRLSNDEETRTFLGGEKSYMFFTWIAQPRLWLSAATGKVHQYDLWDPGQPGVSSFRYEDYVEDATGELSYPSRITYKRTAGHGDDRTAEESTIELSGIRINPDLPPGTFEVK